MGVVVFGWTDEGATIGTCLDKVHRAEGFQLGPLGFWQLRMQDDQGSGHRITLPDLLRKAQKTLRGSADDDVICQPGALREFRLCLEAETLRPAAR